MADSPLPTLPMNWKATGAAWMTFQPGKWRVIGPRGVAYFTLTGPAPIDLHSLDWDDSGECSPSEYVVHRMDDD